MSWGFCWGENWEGWQPHFPSLPQSSSVHNLWSVPSCMLSLCLPALLCQCLFLLFCITLYSLRDIVTLQGHGSTYILRPLKLKVAASLITFRLTTNHIQHDVFPDYSTWAHSLILYLMLYIYQFMPMLHRGRKIYKRGKKKQKYEVVFFFKLSAPTTDLVSFAIQHVHGYFCILKCSVSMPAAAAAAQLKWKSILKSQSGSS